MEISAKLVMKLREQTGAGIMEAKKALAETNCDIDAAVKYLRERGLSKAAKKADRETSEGRIHAYIHSNNRIGVMLEINCETDFVARTDEFLSLCNDVALHIAANNPLAISVENIDPKLIEAEREIYRNKALNEGKPENIVDRIVDGQIKKFLKDNALLEQEFVKDPEKTVGELVKEKIAKLGENIQVARFIRYSLGE